MEDDFYEYDPIWEYDAWEDDSEDDWLSEAGYFDYDRLNEWRLG